MAANNLIDASAPAVVAAAGAAASLFGPLPIVLLCALWGALVGLTRRTAPVGLTGAAKQWNAAGFVFMCTSFGIVGAGGVASIAEGHLTLSATLHHDYLFAACGFCIAVIGARVPDLINAGLDKIAPARKSED
ncbi:hypothetical protein [Nevskia ramosa]|uniref:hypothetical protein n=1 Tax=Nevskia ramosa TaxID=64002 RepID=UPI003D0E1BE5